MIRSILAVVLGVVVGGIVVAIVEAIGHAIYPPPPGVDLYDPEALKAIIGQLPVGAIVFVLVAWGFGALAGGLTAALLAARAPAVHALIVGGIQMACGLVTMLLIPHPLWFMIAAFAIVVPAAWLGARLAAIIRPRGPVGPQPSDMREKGMAC